MIENQKLPAEGSLLRRFSIIIIVLALVVQNAAIGGEIEFQDGEKFWRQSVLRYAKTINFVDYADSISQYLINQGFLDIDVQFVSGKDQNTLWVQFGKRYRVRRIILEDGIADTVQYNGSFDKTGITSVLDSIIESNRARGYYFYSADLVKAPDCNQAIDLIMRITPGPVVTVSSVNITGLESTSPDLVRRYIPILPGDTLRPATMFASTAKIKRLDFIRPVKDPYIVPDAGYNTASVVYEFTERRQFAIDGAAGYSPDDDGNFIWYVNTRLQNFFGGGRKLRLMIDKREKNRSVFSAGYAQPIFLIGTGEAGLHLHTRDYRDQFYEFSFDGRYRLDLNAAVAVNFGLGWKNVEPSDRSLRSYETYMAAAGVRFGGIDDGRLSAGSYSVCWDIQYLGRRYRPGDSSSDLERAVYNDTRNSLILESTLRLFNGFTGYLKTGLVDISSSEKPLPVSELYLFGGPGTLRGYRNDQFAAERAVLVSHEWWFYAGENDYFYPFADYAYFESHRLDAVSDIVKASDSKWGYGFGAKISTDTRLLRVEFSWGEKAAFDEPRLSVIVSGRF